MCSRDALFLLCLTESYRCTTMTKIDAVHLLNPPMVGCPMAQTYDLR